MFRLLVQSISEVEHFGALISENGVQVRYDGARFNHLLVHVLISAPYVTVFDRLEFRQKGVLRNQLINRAYATVNGCVVDKDVGVFRLRVECLHLHVHGGVCGVVAAQVGEDVFAAGHLDHTRYVPRRRRSS